MPDHNRQEFLEPELSTAQANATIGVVGLSGGGSHIVQQLAHLGFRNFVLYDPKAMESKHLHRVVGGCVEDVERQRLKTFVAERTILGICPQARVRAHAQLWQDNPEPLRLCDLVVGCVDTFRGRAELESMCRRYIIPLVDIGMDVFRDDAGGSHMRGQVILSMPGGPCMWCHGFLSREILDLEAAPYGAAGGRPQVVWLNGLLASAAIGLVVDCLTAKFGNAAPCAYTALNGNNNTLTPHNRSLAFAARPCTHYGPDHVGDPRPLRLQRWASLSPAHSELSTSPCTGPDPLA